MSKTPLIEHSLLATFILPVAKALRLRGVDAMQILEDVGIDPAGMVRPDWRIPHNLMNELMHSAVEATEDEAFGLHAAEQLQPQVLHGLGLAWLASDTVYDGLRRLVRFGKLISTGANLSLEEEGDLVHLQVDRTLQIDNFVYAGRDYSVGMIVRMCRLTLGEFIAPVSIEMERPVPDEPERWEYMLASKVVFDAPTTRITWSKSDIEDPLVTGDPGLARVNDEQTQAYLDSFLAQSTSREVVLRIVERLPDGPPNQQQIAEDMNVSNRTLQRKLKEEGTSFMDLLQDTRLQLARKYLRQPGRSVVETAYLLGFSEPSTFSRAFKRWTGVAPAEYRDIEQQH
jgi:AraC-like DNA-binding protein